MKYSDAMISELKALGKLDYASANVFATKHGLPFRSVIAKARALELPYTAKDPKDRSTPSKPKGRDKATIVAGIEGKLGVKLASLPKMTVLDLESLEGVLA